MIGLKQVFGIAMVALVAAVSLSVAPPASAQPDPRDYPNTNRAQTPNNGAGVIFHPVGDKFEIWDNVTDERSVSVFWNYVGIDDEWKGATCKRRYCVIDRNMKEEPHQIYFQILDFYGDSRIVRYRTWGG